MSLLAALAVPSTGYPVPRRFAKGQSRTSVLSSVALGFLKVANPGTGYRVPDTKRGSK
jgi:hypothetical protein